MCRAHCQWVAWASFATRKEAGRRGGVRLGDAVAEHRDRLVIFGTATALAIGGGLIGRLVLSVMVAALENIRLDLLRLKAGVGTADQLTADFNAARDLQAEIEIAVEANREVEAALRPRPAAP